LQMCLQAISSKDLYAKKYWSYSIKCYRHNCSLLVNKFLDYKKKHSNPIPYLRCSKWWRSNQLLLSRQLWQSDSI
jgi:hypothetical protein